VRRRTRTGINSDGTQKDRLQQDVPTPRRARSSMPTWRLPAITSSGPRLSRGHPGRWCSPVGGGGTGRDEFVTTIAGVGGRCPRRAVGPPSTPECCPVPEIAKMWQIKRTPRVAVSMDSVSDRNPTPLASSYTALVRYS